jgi:hypothetical protein
MKMNILYLYDYKIMITAWSTVGVPVGVSDQQSPLSLPFVLMWAVLRRDLWQDDYM